MTKIVLREELLDYWSAENAFDHIRKIEGEIAKAKDNRRVIKFELNDRTYYLKHHVGIGWKEYFKNIFQLKMPVLGASNEWYAIERLMPTEIPVMTAVAFGQQGLNPANQESFLVTRELENTLSLEKLCETWKQSPPSYKRKKALIERVAVIARIMREQGLNHRDFYICHMLLDISQGRDNIDPSALRLYLVDLHRMQLRRRVPKRWLIKDIGSLYFSAAHIGLTKRDIVHFIRSYESYGNRQSVRGLLSSSFWRGVNKRTYKLHRKDFSCDPVLPL